MDATHKMLKIFIYRFYTLILHEFSWHTTWVNHGFAAGSVYIYIYIYIYSLLFIAIARCTYKMFFNTIVHLSEMYSHTTHDCLRRVTKNYNM